ncbi:hypothetical protein GCM10028820_12370 [Tessaracoccus terricola]
MPPGQTPNQPLAKQAPLLWVIIHVGSLLLGLGLAGLTIPLQEGLALIARLGFSAILVLGVALEVIAAWRQTVVLRALGGVAPSPWRWVVVTAAVGAGILAWVWLTGTQSHDADVPATLGTTALGALLLALAIAVGLHFLVNALGATRHPRQAH